jgi:hypothetical protein
VVLGEPDLVQASWRAGPSACSGAGPHRASGFAPAERNPPSVGAIFSWPLVAMKIGDFSYVMMCANAMIEIDTAIAIPPYAMARSSD